MQYDDDVPSVMPYLTGFSLLNIGHWESAHINNNEGASRETTQDLGNGQMICNLCT